MAFLDNSGDIILDAVLTDTGRYRLARGDFKITQFALGDDEIDYSLYNKDHASGSSYYDLEILQTPVLEAFTNNTSSLKSKLMSVARNDYLYLPVIKLNEVASGNTAKHSSGPFLVTVDNDTEVAIGTPSGIMFGYDVANPNVTIQLDQGLDTTEVASTRGLDTDLKELQYIVEIDNRLATVTNPGAVTSFGGTTTSTVGQEMPTSFVDDDNIASYFFSLGTAIGMVEEILDTAADSATEVIAGPRGTRFKFCLKASLDLNTSTYLFEKLGGSAEVSVGTSTAVQAAGGGSTVTCNYIDTTVRVTGATTGYKVDVPVRFIKKK